MNSPIIYNQDIVTTDWLKSKDGYDLFITAGGSDYRSYEVLRTFKKNNINISKVIFFDFTERKDVPTELLKKYMSIDEIGYDVIKIPCSIFTPFEGLKELYETIDIDDFKKLKVGIDITAFPKPYFFSVLNGISKHIKRESINVYYTEPLNYVFSQKNFLSYRSSSGPVSVEVVPSFIGKDKQNIEKVMVVILGFDGDLAKEVKIEIAPDETILFNGFPSFSPKFKDISLITNESLITSKSIVKFSEANNPFFLYNELEEIRESCQESEINIVPLGAKPMALGACMFAIHNPEVRVVYPMPEKYNNSTTSDCLISWFYEIPLQK